jgi:translation initiation factor 5B
MWHANLQATVLEVKAIDGLGMTVDVLIVNGHLQEGDRAVFCTLDGPIVTEIRGLLTPLRAAKCRSIGIHHTKIKGAGVRLETILKGYGGYSRRVIGPEDERILKLRLCPSRSGKQAQYR